MKEEAQKIAIAEKCGAQWRRLYKGINPVGARKRSLVMPEDSKPFNGLEPADLTDEIEQCHDIPDYPNDLNAMRKAEGFLTLEQWDNYIFELHELIGHNHIERYGINAKASQKAQAFLRALNLWIF